MCIEVFKCELLPALRHGEETKAMIVEISIFPWYNEKVAMYTCRDIHLSP